MSARNAGKKPRQGRAVKPVLGNDPFVRGAAQRPPSSALASEAAAPPPAASLPPPPRPAPPEAAAPSAPPEAEAPIARIEARVEQLAREGERRLEAVGELLRGSAQQGQARIGKDLAHLAARLVPFVREKVAALGRLRSAVQGGGPVDPWGQDAELLRAALPALDFLVSAWWRVAVRGLERIPDGPVIVIANHGGVIHWDALVLAHLFRGAGRELRPLLDAPALSSGCIGRAVSRLGAVPASADAAESLLAAGKSIGVFPQGSRAGELPWQDRYRIQQFGRGGFARIALRTGAPVIPCAIVGSEEAAVPFARTGWLAEALSMPLLAAARGVPVGPLEAVPLPSRWSVRFGDPLPTAGRAADAESAAAVNALAAEVRATLQSMLDEDVAARRSVYL